MGFVSQTARGRGKLITRAGPELERQPVVAFDMGRVIVAREWGNIAIPVKMYSASTFTEWALASIWFLVKLLTPGRVYIIKNAATRELARNALELLERLRFFQITGMSKDHFVCSKKRVTKAADCERYGVTHMIDDRAYVGRFLPKHVTFYWFNPLPSDRTEHGAALVARQRQEAFNWIEVEEWPEILEHFLEKCAPEKVTQVIAFAYPDKTDEEMRRIVQRMFRNYPLLGKYLPFGDPTTP